MKKYTMNKLTNPSSKQHICISKCLLDYSSYQPLAPGRLANTKYACSQTQFNKPLPHSQPISSFQPSALLFIELTSPSQPEAKPEFSLSLLVPDWPNHSLYMSLPFHLSLYNPSPGHHFIWLAHCSRGLVSPPQTSPPKAELASCQFLAPHQWLTISYHMKYVLFHLHLSSLHSHSDQPSQVAWDDPSFSTTSSISSQLLAKQTIGHSIYNRTPTRHSSLCPIFCLTTMLQSTQRFN